MDKSKRQVIFSHFEPSHRKHIVLPVFLPFSGCPKRCIYCAQHLQTGSRATDYHVIYNKLKKQLERLHSPCGRQQAPEVGFFGGTFTGLPRKVIEQFLILTRSFQKKGIISRVRCSTRPDYITPEQLQWLKGLGMGCIELGIQSFSDQVLKAADRGYSASVAREACRLVKDAGLSLGIQLLPGLPAHNRKVFSEDIKTTIAMEPETVRLYPCLVIRNTPLARLYARDMYRPWKMEETIKALCAATLKLWKHQIPVARIGLAPEQDLLEQVIAGPWHPALGNIVRSTLLYFRIKVQALLLGPGSKKIFCPQRHAGEIWGYQATLKKKYQKIGISPRNTSFWDKPFFQLSLAPDSPDRI